MAGTPMTQKPTPSSLLTKIGSARLLIAAAVAVILSIGLFSTGHAPPPADDLRLAIAGLFASTATSPGGQPQALKEWQGQIVVVNYWATWCPPCRQEMPALGRLSRQFSDKGVQFIGIAIDSAENVQKYVANNSASPYPLLVGAPEALEQSRALGNQRLALPFTIVIDRQGRHHYSRLGAIDEARLEMQLQQLTKAP